MLQIVNNTESKEINVFAVYQHVFFHRLKILDYKNV